MNIVSSSDLIKIFDEKSIGIDVIPDYIIELLIKLDIQFEFYILPTCSVWSDVAEYIESVVYDIDNLTIIYCDRNDGKTHLAFANVSWNNLVSLIKRAQKIKVFI